MTKLTVMAQKADSVGLLAGSNWNNGTNAEVAYLNSNNVSSIANRNISTRTELMAMGLALNSAITRTPQSRSQIHNALARGVSTQKGTLREPAGLYKL